MNSKACIWERLLEYYTEDEAVEWLASPQPQLNDEVPAKLLAREDGSQRRRIHHLLNQLDGSIGS